MILVIHNLSVELPSQMSGALKGAFQPACIARVITSLGIVVAICQAHEHGDNDGQQRKRWYMQSMLVETYPLSKDLFSEKGTPLSENCK